MTCIVGLVDDLGAVWLGGDRAGVEGSHYLIRSGQPKVFRRGDTIIGYTTSFRMGQLLQYRLQVPEVPDAMPLDEYMATAFTDAVRECMKEGGWAKVTDGREKIGQFLVGIRGNLYAFDDDSNVLRFDCNYGAVGSGVTAAQASLHTSAALRVTDPPVRILMALEAAASFVTTVSGPFDVVYLDDPAREAPPPR